MRKASNSASRSNEFQVVFDQLKQIVQKSAAGTKLAVIDDFPGNYSLTAGYSERFKKDLWFGGVRSGKSYVSLHLMPVYMNPKMLDGASEELRSRMQGKSCFNFRTPLEPAMLREVSDLIDRCIDGARNWLASPQQEQQQSEKRNQLKRGPTKSRSKPRSRRTAS